MRGGGGADAEQDVAGYESSGWGGRRSRALRAVAAARGRCGRGGRVGVKARNPMAAARWEVVETMGEESTRGEAEPHSGSNQPGLRHSGSCRLSRAGFVSGYL
jgi:hypothetical protein